MLWRHVLLGRRRPGAAGDQVLHPRCLNHVRPTCRLRGSEGRRLRCQVVQPCLQDQRPAEPRAALAALRQRIMEGEAEGTGDDFGRENDHAFPRLAFRRRHRDPVLVLRDVAGEGRLRLQVADVAAGPNDRPDRQRLFERQPQEPLGLVGLIRQPTPMRRQRPANVQRPQQPLRAGRCKGKPALGRRVRGKLRGIGDVEIGFGDDRLEETGRDGRRLHRPARDGRRQNRHRDRGQCACFHYR